MAKEVKKTKEELEEEFNELIMKRIEDKNKESSINDLKVFD